MEELATKETIFQYIPQRDPICLVHCVYECSFQASKTGFLVEPDHIFVANSKLSEAGVIENLAQSVAAQAGYLTVINNQQPKLGFIANIKNLEIFSLPPVHSEVITHITVKSQVMNFTLIEAASFANGQPVAVCEMKIFLQE
ncbi:MAG: hydroxymyristoyl-ACP dehydratase [Bacteroidia bacterium]